MIVIGFDDFRKFGEENNKRVYYYQTENVLEMYYIVDSIIIKSYVDLGKIENKEIFFGYKLFQGAIKLLFNIPQDDTKVRNPLSTGIVITDFQPLETKNTDIQKEAIQE